MKVRTAADVAKLDQKITNELGIDVQKYRSEEVVETFISLLVFPEYIVVWGIRPILISLALFVLGFFVLDLVHIEYLLYVSICFSLFLVAGILAGVLFVIWKMRSDMWRVLDYSLQVMKTAVSDLNQVNQQVNAENRKDVLSLLFKGVIHIVTIPMLSTVISEKIPLIGGLISRVVKKILTLIADRLKFDEQKLQEELQKESHESSAIEAYTKVISGVSSSLQTLLNITFRAAQFPLLFVFLIVFGLLYTVVWFLN